MNGKRKWKTNTKIKLIILVFFSMFSILFSKEVKATEISGTGTLDDPWDVSENADKSVLVMLSEEGTLTIKGTGRAKEISLVPWREQRDQIKKVVIEDGVTYIGKWYISNCERVKRLEIGNSIENVEIESLFFESVELEDIWVGKDNTYYSSEGGVLFNKEKTELLKYPAKKSGMDYVMPDTVQKIKSYAFYQNAYLKNIAFSEGLLEIEKYAFEGTCSLSQIQISSKVTNIDKDAFYGCYSIENFIVNNENINCSSDSGVLFNKEKTELLKYPTRKNETQYKIPNGVIKIHKDAFYKSELKEIEFTNSVKEIGESAFANCKSLSSINFPNGLETIRENAFLWCEELINVELPDTVVLLEKGAFRGCDKMETIRLPAQLT